MANHTPGPWKLGKITKRGRQRINGDGWSELAKVVVRMKGALTTCEDGLANARLIAAAPELLEALKDLERVSGIPLPHDDPSRVTARAAIAKAEGGEA